MRHIFNAEADASHAILAEADHCDIVAQCQDIFHMVDALFRDLGNVNHAFLARCKFYESAELLNADNFTLEDLAFLKFCRDGLNVFHCLVHHCLIGAADEYIAVVIDIDLYACARDDLVDGFAALSYDITDLLRINADLDDFGA